MGSGCNNDGDGDDELMEVGEVVREEVGADWDDDVVSAARFKAFSGQRSDWDSAKFFFWRHLILRVARRLRLCAASSHHVAHVWFRRGGVTPLCLPQILEEMRIRGDISLKSHLSHPATGRLYQFFARFARMAATPTSLILHDDLLFFKPLIEERAAEIIEHLKEGHWTSTCIISIEKFGSFFKGQDEAYGALCYLTQCGKARYLSARMEEDPIEGVKFSLVAAQVPAISKLDYDSLHLIWTAEKLQQQLHGLDHHWNISRKRALASSRSGDKQAAYRHIRQSRLFSEGRDRCTSLLEQVEQVISLIADAESTKKVYEAIQIGTRAIKEHSVSLEEAQIHLKEVDDLVTAQKEVDAALELAPLQSLNAEDVEEEFRKLEEEMKDEIPHTQVEGLVASHEKEAAPDEVVGSLSHNLSTLNLEAV